MWLLGMKSVCSQSIISAINLWATSPIPGLESLCLYTGLRECACVCSCVPENTPDSDHRGRWAHTGALSWEPDNEGLPLSKVTERTRVTDDITEYSQDPSDHVVTQAGSGWRASAQPTPALTEILGAGLKSWNTILWNAGENKHQPMGPQSAWPAQSPQRRTRAYAGQVLSRWGRGRLVSDVIKEPCWFYEVDGGRAMKKEIIGGKLVLPRLLCI